MRVWTTKYAVLVWLFAAQTLIANPQHSCGEFEASVGALYWKTMQCYTAYVHQQTQPAAGFFRQDVVPLAPDYKWGVEARLGYRMGCYGAQISYVWYENWTDRIFRSATPNLFPTGLTVASTVVGGRLSQEYQKIDGRLMRTLRGTCDFKYHLFVNGRWLQLDRLLDTESLSSPTTASNRTQESFRGGAFGLGVGCEWNCRPWFHLFGEFNPMVAIGRRKDFERILQGGGRLERELRPEMAALPALDARAGAAINCSVGPIDVGVELGWSINYYWSVFPQNIPTAPVIRRVFNCDSIGFTGPFVAIRASYNLT